MPGLTLKEAYAKADKLNAIPQVTAHVVTILPNDNPRPRDRAFDVEITVGDTSIRASAMARIIKRTETEA